MSIAGDNSSASCPRSCGVMGQSERGWIEATQEIVQLFLSKLLVFKGFPGAPFAGDLVVDQGLLVVFDGVGHEARLRDLGR